MSKKGGTSRATLKLEIEYDLDQTRLRDVVEAIGEVLDKATEQGGITFQEFTVNGTEVPL